VGDGGFGFLLNTGKRDRKVVTYDVDAIVKKQSARAIEQVLESSIPICCNAKPTRCAIQPVEQIRGVIPTQPSAQGPNSK
jgi:hypothetical protein